MLESGIPSRLICTASQEDIAEPPATLKLKRLWNNRFFFGWNSASRIREAVEEADIVHVHGLYTYMNYLAGKYCREQSKTLIYHPHGSLVPAYLKMGRIKKSIVLWAFESRNFREVAALRALSAAEEAQILDYIPGAKTFVIPNGVSLPKQFFKATGHNSELALVTKSTKRVFLFLSRMRFAKGIDLLIDAWASAGVPGCELWIAGPDVDGTEQRLRKQIDDRQLKNIVLIGAVSDENKSWLLRAIDVFVLTSRGEGQSPAVLEAMAYGKPVLLTTTCYFPEAEEAGAGLVCEPNVADIAELISQFTQMQNADLETMGKRGRLLVAERHNILNIARNLDLRSKDIVETL